MAGEAERLIADFKKMGWKMPQPYERLYEFKEDAAEAYLFADQYLRTFTDSSALFNDALSYVEKEDMKKLIRSSLEILQKQENENAECVIETASIQYPCLLHEYIELIYDLAPNGSTYFFAWPWRKLDQDRIKIFKDRVSGSDTALDEKQRLFKCLLETRDLETIQFAVDYVKKHKGVIEKTDDGYLCWYLELVGYTIQDGRVKSYCPNEVRHFSFAKDYFKPSSAVWLNKEQHPTWKLTPERQEYKFGGLLEAHASNPLFHLITFDPVPSHLYISGIDHLVMGAHLREMNECGPVFYKHDKLGYPHRLGEQIAVEIYEDEAIVETKVRFSNTPERWEFQSVGASNSRENLFRLGGEPTWIQDAEVLVCPECKGKMDFLLQINSDLPTLGGEMMFGDAGICYAFWCDESKVSGYVMQCG